MQHKIKYNLNVIFTRAFELGFVNKNLITDCYTAIICQHVR